MWLYVFVGQLWAIPGLESLLSSPEKKEFTKFCQGTLDHLDRLEAEHGNISKEKIKAYSSAHLNLGYVVGACANVQTKFGTELQEKQKTAVKRLYDVFLQKHLLIDLHGNGSSFDPTAQNLFTSYPPMDKAHFLCKPERMETVDNFIERSWLTTELKKLKETVHGKTPLVDFENKLEGEYKNFFVIAKEKANNCLESKLDQVRPYTNAAPSSVQKEWDSAVRRAVADHTKKPIARIVYPYSQFKRFTTERREIRSDGTIDVQKMDYDAMDVFVYMVNGKFVDGYIVTLYKDYMQKSEYARFYGLDASGKLRPSQRLLKSNF